MLHPRQIEIEPTVVVDITPRDTFDETRRGDTGQRGNIRERPVAVVAIELAGMCVAVGGLVADEQVEPAVIVEVSPRGCLGWVEAQ